MRKAIVLETVFILIVTLTLCAGVAMAEEKAAPAVPAILKAGSMLPEDVKITTMDGAEKPLKSVLENDYTIIQFMTTACSACQAELGKLMEIRDLNPGKVGLFALSMDLMGADAVKVYEERYKYGITYYLDSMFSVPPRFGFTSTPAFVIVERNGNILYAKRGFLASRWDQTSEEIQNLF